MAPLEKNQQGFGGSSGGWSLFALRFHVLQNLCVLSSHDWEILDGTVIGISVTPFCGDVETPTSHQFCYNHVNKASA